MRLTCPLQRDDLVREERLNGPRPFTLDRLLTVHKGLLKAAVSCGVGQ